MLIARTSSHLSSLNSSTGYSVMAHTVCPFPLTWHDQARFQFPCLSWHGLSSLTGKKRSNLRTPSLSGPYTLLGPLRSPYSDRSSVVNFPARAQRSFPFSLQTGLVIFSPCSCQMGLTDWIIPPSTCDILDVFASVNFVKNVTSFSTP